jgi:hypothetical protein
MCKNLQYFIFQFYSIDRYSRSEPFTDLTKMIQLLNMDKISKKYQIKHIHNYFQFVKIIIIGSLKISHSGNNKFSPFILSLCQ